MPQHRGRRPARDFTILHRRRKVAALYLRNYTQQEIARELDCTQALISLDLKEIRKQWIASGVMDFNERRSQELAKIDHLEQTYWEAWDRSCQPKEGTSKKKQTTGGSAGGDDDDGSKDRFEVSTKVEPRDGNPEFLRGVERCIEQRCKLLQLITQQVEMRGMAALVITEEVVEVTSKDVEIAVTTQEGGGNDGGNAGDGQPALTYNP